MPDMSWALVVNVTLPTGAPWGLCGAVIIFLWAPHARPRLDYTVGTQTPGLEWKAMQKSRVLPSWIGISGRKALDYHWYCYECWESKTRVPALFLLFLSYVTSGKAFPFLVFSSPYYTRKGLEKVNSRAQFTEPRMRSGTQQEPGNDYIICDIRGQMQWG